MKSINTYGKTLFFVFSLFFGLLSSQSSVAETTLVFIVNKENKNEAPSLDMIKRYYLGSTTFWKSGTRVSAYSMSDDSEAAKTFFKSVLKMTPRRFRFHWKKNELAGKGVFRKPLAGAQEILKKVVEEPGSIGFVLQSDLSETDLAQVRVIKEFFEN